MPYARKPRKTTRAPRRRPSGVRKKQFTKRTVFRPQRLLRVGFPKTTAVKLRYVEGVSINPGIGSLATYSFRANSAYDPNASGTGHQPMNFDTWSTLYNHYLVVGSKITARLHSNSTDVAGGLLFGINLSDDLTFSSDASTLMEQGLSRYRMANVSSNANSGNGLVVSKGFSCKEFFNLTNPTDNINRVGSTVLNNPNEMAFFVIFMGTPPGSVVDLSSYSITVQIEYIVIFSEPKEQIQS